MKRTIKPVTEYDNILLLHIQGPNFSAPGPRHLQIAQAAYDIFSDLASTPFNSDLTLRGFVESAIWFARRERINERQERALRLAVDFMVGYICYGVSERWLVRIGAGVLLELTE